MNNNKFWFYVYPNIYVVQKENKTMLYNTDTGNILYSNDPILNKWIAEVYISRNMGVISLTEDVIKNCNNELLKEALEKKMVNLQPVASHPLKPVNFLPILNLQKDFEDIKNDHSTELMGDDIISYLSELNIFLLTDGSNSPKWNIVSHQLLFPDSTDYHGKQLEYSVIEHLLSESKYSIMKEINFIGGDLKHYRSWEKLANVPNLFPQFRFHLWFTSEHISSIQDISVTGFYYDIIILQSEEKELKRLQKEISSLSIPHDKVMLHHYATSKEICEKFDTIFAKYQTETLPLYDGNNIEFFKECVYLEEDDILSTPINMRMIFCNQKVNSNFFGTLNVYPDGSIKATTDTTVLGNLHEKNIKEIIYKELVTNTAWRHIRKNEVCDKCFYQFLCPPPGPYEKALGLNNLCHISR